MHRAVLILMIGVSAVACGGGDAEESLVTAELSFQGDGAEMTGAVEFEQASAPAAGDEALASKKDDVGTQDVTKDVWPQRTEGFPTYWWWRTNWKVANPHDAWVQVHVSCAIHGYSEWYWVAPYGEVKAAWGCEGRELFVFNNADQYSNLWVRVTTW